MNDFDADIIVIGSGPAGVSASFPLVEAGCRVLMIDGASVPRAVASSRWERSFGVDLQALQPDDQLSPKLRTPIARTIIGAFREHVHIEERNFYVTGALGRGGLSRVWGGFAAELDDDDMVGWPFRAESLRPSYRTMVERIGVSGSCDDDMASFFGRSGRLLPPPEISPAANALLTAYRRTKLTNDFALGLARNALLTQDRAERQACNLSQSCLWGCERGAIYDANFDLVQLRRNPCFELRVGTKAIGLKRIMGGWEVIATGSQEGLRAPRVLVAAGPFGTLRLILPLIAPSESGTLRVQNSPVLASPLLVAGRIGAEASARGFSLAQLGYRVAFGAAPGEYAMGGIYDVAGLPVSSFASRIPLGRRAATELLKALASSLVVATTYFPGVYSANSVSWRRGENGLNIAISGGTTPQMEDVAARVRARLRGIWRRLGAWSLPGASFAIPGTDAHIGGTFPMGNNDWYGTSTSGELRSAEGIHIVDGSVLPTIPSKFTTLTIMANAHRIGVGLAGAFRRAG